MTSEQIGYSAGVLLPAILALLAIQYARKIKVPWRREVSIGTLAFIFSVSLLSFLQIGVVVAIPFAVFVYFLGSQLGKDKNTNENH